MKKTLPHICPGCSDRLNVKSLVCENCHTEVHGSFNLPLLASLSEQEQEFIIAFVKSSGSLKVMAQQLRLSYPTVRNLLDDIIAKVKENENNLNQTQL